MILTGILSSSVCLSEFETTTTDQMWISVFCLLLQVRLFDLENFMAHSLQSDC